MTDGALYIAPQPNRHVGAGPRLIPALLHAYDCARRFVRLSSSRPAAQSLPSPLDNVQR
ncbi:hypothetical protein FA95DRAFT_1564403 [Auriscalpium vulgare]|uniref:Uncharacterized protein n=1 Tax=Auriscalpium vulgare TaxID=40419 RepID=A0ACB8RDV0_9AGAM|nr:hypothetical protein FA95DRAFT_1564403 [Auriscalpium vulgare]